MKQDCTDVKSYTNFHMSSIWLFLFGVVDLLLIIKGVRIPSSVCRTAACKKTAQRLIEYMDPSVRPCDNFYKFACGNFVNNAKIFDDQFQNSSFEQVEGRLQDQLKTILYKKTYPNEPTSFKKLKHLVSLCMDERKMNARGVGHAVSLMKKAGGWPVLGNWNKKNWNFLDTQVKLRNFFISGGSLFSLGVTTDLKIPTRRVIEVDQPTMSMREFLVRGPDNPIVKAYFSYMVDIAVLYGAKRETATKMFHKTLLFEIELAKITVPLEKRRDGHRMYNPYRLPRLKAQIGWIDWSKLLQTMLPKCTTLKKNELINVKEVGYLKALKTLLHKHSNEVIANYMMWQSAYIMASSLTNAMRNRAFEFSKVVSGTTARHPRWKECISLASSFPHASSAMYIKNFFDERSKKVALEMTKRILHEMSTDIKKINWMDKQTRKKAEYKLSKMAYHIGYPDELKDTNNIDEYYEELRLNNKHYFEASLDLARWARKKAYQELRKRVNTTDWRHHGNVATANAFYSPQENSIQVPAGILQQPFFNDDVPKYVNYASMGTIIGHEITHGFDDEGSQYDFNGALKDWWRKESKRNFNKKKKCIINQYGRYRDNQTDLNVNGINTQGENIADNGGFKIAYRAYKKMSRKMRPEPLLPGLVGYSRDQLFMLSMANLWCTRFRTEALKTRIVTDNHSPPEFRVNGILMNMPEFSEIFQCNAEDYMNPREKCSVW